MTTLDTPVPASYLHDSTVPRDASGVPIIDASLLRQKDLATISPDLPDYERVIALCERFLELIQTEYHRANVNLPPRQIITHGTPVADCEEVVIYFGSLGEGFPGMQLDLNCVPGLTVTLNAQVIRCVPTAGANGQAPSPEDLYQAARLHSIDMMLLMAAARGLAGDMGRTVNVNAGEPQGGFAGPSVSVTMALP
jgi:hypothetical protein